VSRSGGATLDLWLSSLPRDETTLDALARTLAPEEAARAARFLNADAARQYVAARGILRQIVAARLDCSPRDVRFAYGAFQKPVLDASHARHLHFNVSHAGGLAAYALCEDAEVGVDIETDDGHAEPAELAPTICSAGELEELRGFPRDMQRDVFFRLWTRKEAYLKCLGSGLTMEPRAVTVPIGESAEVIVGEGELRCAIRTYRVAPGVQVSVAARGSCTEVRSFRWWPTSASVCW